MGLTHGCVAMGRVMDQRHGAVLATVVEQHVMTARPVSSGAVARRCHLRMSPATVRNVMAELDAEGLLEQPHRSGGRIPTDKGYRHYVDKLMRVRGLTSGEKRFIMSEIKNACRDVETVLRAACGLLSRMWGQMALGLGPSVSEGSLRRISLISVASDRVLVVITVASGIAKSFLVDTHLPVSEAKLEAAERLLNERLLGLALAEALAIIRSDPHAFCGGDATVRHVLMRVASQETLSRLEGELYVEGTSRVLEQPEFESTDKIGPFLKVVEAREPLLKELASVRHQPIPTVVIGTENRLHELHGCSLVAAGYRSGQVSGALGVVGPVRMPYGSLLPAVQFIANAVSDVLSMQGRLQ